MNKQKIEIIGRVVVKPELQKSKSKKQYSKVRVAVNSVIKNKKGKEEDVATYYQILIFGNLANKSKNFNKGMLVRSVGDLAVKTYLSKKGEPKADLTVISDEIQVLDSKAFK